jgi:gamma-glutamylcyclotransferase (GGCT)/AIG2-like uncharacterized protein YtfP
MKNLVFTYGSLMASRSMNKGAKYIGVARLANYKWEMLCYANIFPAGTDSAVGVVWEVDQDILADLDHREGYPYMYDRIPVTVNLFEGNVTVLVYTMTPEYRRRLSKIPPTESYLNIVREGFAEYNIEYPTR